MNLSAVLLTGLFAGGVSCAAVQGGLLTGLVARQRDVAPANRSAARVPVRAGAGARNPGGVRKKTPGTKTAGTKTAGTKAGTRDAVRSPVEAAQPLTARIVDDLIPVGGFLAGKLVAYTALGALLGAVGTAVQMSVGLRATAQLAAGALVIAFGLAQLQVRGFTRFVIQPPASWSRFVRGRARSQSAFAPTVLGLATVLIPCGVTLSVEALALTSGSMWSGAATMAVFVIGTSPMFAVLGYVARRAASAWKGRLAAATGVLVIGMGLYTFNGGLTLIDSPIAAANLGQTLGFAPPPASADTVSTDPTGRQIAVLTAESSAYTPANIALRADVPTTLLVRTQRNFGCTRALVIAGKQYVLPETGDTPIDLGRLQPGTLRYRCGMGMYSGQLTIAR